MGRRPCRLVDAPTAWTPASFCRWPVAVALLLYASSPGPPSYSINLLASSPASNLPVIISLYSASRSRRKRMRRKEKEIRCIHPKTRCQPPGTRQRPRLRRVDGASGQVCRMAGKRRSRHPSSPARHHRRSISITPSRPNGNRGMRNNLQYHSKEQL